MDLWSQDQENILETIRQDCKKLHTYHRSQYLINELDLRKYKIPIIIISTINSVASVGLDRYMDQHYISALTCVLSLLVVIIGSIESFLGIQKQMENNLITSKDAYFLAISIYKVLSLDKHHRTQTGAECLTEIYDKFIKINECSLVIKKKSIKYPLLDSPISSIKQTLSLSTSTSLDSESDLYSDASSNSI